MKQILFLMVVLMVILPLATFSQDQLNSEQGAQLPALSEVSANLSIGSTTDLGAVTSFSTIITPAKWSITKASQRINIGFHIGARSQDSDNTIFGIGPAITVTSPKITTDLIVSVGAASYTSRGFPDSAHSQYFRSSMNYDARIAVAKTIKPGDILSWRTELILGNQGLSEFPASVFRLYDGEKFCYQASGQLNFGFYPKDKLGITMSMRALVGRDQLGSFFGPGFAINGYYKYFDKPLFSLSYDYLFDNLSDGRSNYKLTVDVGMLFEQWNSN